MTEQTPMTITIDVEQRYGPVLRAIDEQAFNTLAQALRTAISESADPRGIAERLVTVARAAAETASADTGEGRQ